MNEKLKRRSRNDACLLDTTVVIPLAITETTLVFQCLQHTQYLLLVQRSSGQNQTGGYTGAVQ